MCYRSQRLQLERSSPGPAPRDLDTPSLYRRTTVLVEYKRRARDETTLRPRTPHRPTASGFLQTSPYTRAWRPLRTLPRGRDDVPLYAHLIARTDHLHGPGQVVAYLLLDCSAMLTVRPCFGASRGPDDCCRFRRQREAGRITGSMFPAKSQPWLRFTRGVLPRRRAKSKPTPFHAIPAAIPALR